MEFPIILKRNKKSLLFAIMLIAFSVALMILTIVGLVHYDTHKIGAVIGIICFLFLGVIGVDLLLDAILFRVTITKDGMITIRTSTSKEMTRPESEVEWSIHKTTEGKEKQFIQFPMVEDGGKKKLFRADENCKNYKESCFWLRELKVIRKNKAIWDDILSHKYYVPGNLLKDKDGFHFLPCILRNKEGSSVIPAFESEEILLKVNQGKRGPIREGPMYSIVKLTENFTKADGVVIVSLDEENHPQYFEIYENYWNHMDQYRLREEGQ